MLEENGICCYGHCELFIHYKDCNLKIWRMNTALDMKFVRSLHFPTIIPNNFLYLEICEIDDEYIAVFILAIAAPNSRGRREETERWCTVYFVSTETLQLERSLSVNCKFNPRPRYERAVLVIPLTDSIR